MKALIDFWGGHGTKVLGYLTGIVAAALITPDLIAPGHMKYWLFANVVLGGATVRRGHTNTANQETK